MAGKKYSVVLVDDSEDDRWLMRRALQNSSMFSVVGEVDNGKTAMDYLSGEGQFKNRENHPFPDVILLDLKMPRVTGHEVLNWLQNQSFKGLFVAVISGSVLPGDTTRSMALGAKAHYEKNALIQDQTAMINSLGQLVDRFKST